MSLVIYINYVQLSPCERLNETLHCKALWMKLLYKCSICSFVLLDLKMYISVLVYLQ